MRYQINISTLGVLEMAYKFPVLINFLFVMPFMRSWFPKRMEIADEPGAPRRIGQMYTYYLYITLLGGLLLAVDIPTVLKLLTPPEFWPGFRPARVEILNHLVGASVAYLHFGLEYAKRTGLMSRIMIGTSLIKIGISYFMISQWGILGAAWSGMITASIRLVWGYFPANRSYHLMIEWRRVFIIIGTAATLFVLIDRLETETIAVWGAPLLEKSRHLLEGLQDTWLGELKDGKVLRVLIQKGDLVLDLAVRTLLAALFLLLLPVINVRAGRGFLRKMTNFKNGHFHRRIKSE